MDYYASCSGNSSPTFREKPFGPILKGVQGSRILDSWTLKMGPICCPETSERNYHYRLRNISEEGSYRQNQRSIDTMHLVHGKNILSVNE